MKKASAHLIHSEHRTDHTIQKCKKDQFEEHASRLGVFEEPHFRKKQTFITTTKTHEVSL